MVHTLTFKLKLTLCSKFWLVCRFMLKCLFRLCFCLQIYQCLRLLLPLFMLWILSARLICFFYSAHQSDNHNVFSIFLSFVELVIGCSLLMLGVRSSFEWSRQLCESSAQNASFDVGLALFNDVVDDAAVAAAVRLVSPYKYMFT